MSRTKFIIAAMLLLLPVAAAVAGFKGAAYKVRKTRRASSKDRSKQALESVLAVEFEVSADEPFPARALDPVLHVGGMELRDYRYTDIENKTLIFTAAEPEKLEDDVTVFLQYENDTRTRTDLPRFYRKMIE